MNNRNPTFYAVSFVLGALFTMAFSCQSNAEPRVYKLDLTYQKLFHNSDPMVPEIRHKDWGDAVGIETGISAGRWYLEANPHFESAYSKVMTVGLLFNTGFDLTNWLAFEWTHHSRHSADRQNAYADEPNQQTTAYPLKDAVGVRLQFIPNARRPR